MIPKQYSVEKELFEIPHLGKSLIYAPLRRTVLWVDKGVVHLLCDLRDGIPVDLDRHGKTIARLQRLRIIREFHGGEIKEREKGKKEAIDYHQAFLPVNLTLFLTSDCNMECRYCYGDGGDRPETLPLEIGRDAIDLLFLNAAKSGIQEVHLGFHGGGEPILKRKKLLQLVDHARKLSDRRRIRLQLGLSTNAVMSRQSAQWVAENITQLNVSFDGHPEVQNHQRPMKNGTNSYFQVKETLHYWDQRSKKYSIRGTISSYSQGDIPLIVGHIVDHFQPASIQLEPMFESRRAIRHGLKPPEAKAFVDGFLLACRMAEQKGIVLHFSGSHFPGIKETFCGIGWKNWAITPEGKVTSCFEVLSEEDQRADHFLYGRYVSGKGFQFDMEKIAALRRMSSEEAEGCRHCFAKFHCAGDCRAKVLFRKSEESMPGAGRCEIIQGIVKGKLLEQLSLNSEGDGAYVKE